MVVDYLALLRELSALDPPIFVFGSVAEAALLEGKLAESHGDVDLLIPRSELGLRLLQLGELGFAEFTVYYEPRPGLPLVYGSTRDEIALELSLFDLDPAGNPFFVVSTDDGPAAISSRPTCSSGLPRSSTTFRSTHSALLLSFTSVRGRPRPGRSGHPVHEIALVRPTWSKPSLRTSTRQDSRPRSRSSAACTSRAQVAPAFRKSPELPGRDRTGMAPDLGVAR